MPVDYLYWLDQIHPPHRSSVGDKAFYLALLMQRGYDVIPGFVISADAFQEFLEQINWLEPMFADLPNSSLHVDVDNSRQLQAIASQIRQAIQTATVPESWLTQLDKALQGWSTQAIILRPSFSLPSGSDPTVSLRTTGLLESHLCQIDRQAIGQGLKQVWAELFRARSLLYWQRLNIHPQQIRLAVLVQPICSAIASGDVRVHKTHLEIRATWGLGKALVLGEAMPDCYQVFNNSEQWTYRLGNQTRVYRIAEEAVSGSPLALPFQSDGYVTAPIEPVQHRQPVLTDSQIHTLVRLTRQVAADLGTALDLEWTLNSSLAPTPTPTLYLTQAVPQLGLALGDRQLPAAHLSRPAAELQPHSSASRLTGLAAAPGKVRAIAYVLSDLDLADLAPIPPDAILVVSWLTPDWLLGLKHLAGIITEQGGMTSHGAILAREQGIPAVVGVEQATRRIETGDWLLLDGDRGEVYQYQQSSQYRQSSDSSTAALVALPIAPAVAATSPEVLSAVEPVNATQLWVTLSQPSTIAQVAHLPIDGVGLLRAELLLAVEGQPPQEWLHQGQRSAFIQHLAHQVERFTQAFAPRPVFYRSLDWRSHEFHSLKPSAPESGANPALGLRGTLSYQVDPALFEAELAALRQVQHWGYNNLRLILPFVRTVEEFVFCRQRVEQAGLSQLPQFQLWIMAEVPSVLLLLPDYFAAGVQGVAIGTNDLTQLLLGVDRDQRQLASAFNPGHPAVMRAIHQIIETARRANIPCSLCGQGPSQSPDLIEALVRWGITAISVEPVEIAPAYRAIARAEKRLLLEAAQSSLPPPLP